VRGEKRKREDEERKVGKWRSQLLGEEWYEETEETEEESDG